MDKSRNKSFLLFDKIICFLKWARRSVFIVVAAFMIGFTNALNDESKLISDIRHLDQSEQSIDDKNINE